MIYQKDFSIEKLDFPGRKLDECSFGFPLGEGIKFGYSGWGKIDIALDPRLPIDMCVDQMGLHGKFKKVISQNLVNNIHGDCNLTHAILGLLLLLDNDGILELSFFATGDIAQDAISFLRNNKFDKCQCLEKFCFKPPEDDSCLIYQQTFLNEERICSLIDCDKFDFRIIKKSRKGELVFSPDDIRLQGIPDEIWLSSKSINTISDSLDIDRPRCIVCRKPSTKMDENRFFFSKYCRNHYHEARQLYAKQITDFYTVNIKVWRINNVI